MDSLQKDFSAADMQNLVIALNFMVKVSIVLEFETLGKVFIDL